MSAVTQIRPATVQPKAAPKRSSKAVRRMRQQALAGSGIVAVALTLVVLSLTHLSDGVQAITHVPAWQAWAMAVGIDLSFVALETADLACATDKLRRSIKRWTAPSIWGTLVASAALNAFAFASDCHGYWMIPAALFGIAVPALIYALTRVGTAMWLDHRSANA